MPAKSGLNRIIQPVQRIREPRLFKEFRQTPKAGRCPVISSAALRADEHEAYVHTLIDGFMIRLAASPSGGLPRRRPASARAFTLIEILVALAILSSGLLAIYRLQASAVQLAVRARDTMAAADFAASLIRAWELDPPGIGSRQGEAVFQGAEMKWQADFSKAPFSGLLRVDLNIQLAGQRPGSLFSGSFLAPENGSLALGAEWAH